MKVIYPSGTGGNPFDRNPLFLHKSIQSAIPQGQMDLTIVEYTVPANRKAILTNLQGSVYCADTPTVKDQTQIYITIYLGASSWMIANISNSEMLLDKMISTAMMHDVYLDPGSNIVVAATNLNTGGTFSAYVTFEGLEFE